ncbi:hypothetical protein [Aerococcus urinaeequi]|uniref:hypothetical protein n=1 Tax=Aerococcus urinaeequi TaxID=51665 RepID=UPI003D6B2360
MELNFQLKEVEYDFDSAEIILLNVDDRSLVTRPVVKSAEGFTYELEDDIVAHYGEWKGQLKFDEGGEIYVSSPVGFRIENDLTNDRPPQLTEVNNWKNLRTIADGLIVDIRSELASVAERLSEIEGAETTRQQAEAARQSTFEVNETERQNVFETAEQGRQSAELIRMENENQRNTDHANRSAELSGKADKKQEDWITPTLLNGAESVADKPFKYMKDSLGFVHFQGSLTHQSTSQNITQLPVGYRPEISIDFITHNSNKASVWANGNVYIFTGVGSVNSFNYLTYKAVE